METTPLPLPLPFDDGTDDAVPFVLTAAAHREVLGRPVPPLVAVGPAAQGHAPEVQHDAEVEPEVEPEVEDEAGDTRRMQARALLRSGMPVPTIAAALGVPEARVERWTVDLVDELARRRRRSAAAHRQDTVPLARPAPHRSVQPSVAPSAEGRARLIPGLALACAEVDPDGVALVRGGLEEFALLLGAIREVHVLDASRIRVAARIAVDVAADRALRTIAEELAVDPATIVVGRARPDAAQDVELRIDVRDARAAGLVTEWRAGRTTGLRGWDSNPQTFRLTADCSAS